MADEVTTTKSKGKADTPKGYREVTFLVGDNVDDATVEEAIRSLAPGVPGIVGNYADVQRGGAAVILGQGSMSDGVELPPAGAGVDQAEQARLAVKIEETVEAAKNGTTSSVGDPKTGASIPGGTYNVKGAK